jgi:hypothetical protein
MLCISPCVFPSVPRAVQLNLLLLKNDVFGMLRRVDLVRTGVSEELTASTIIVTRIGELGTKLA